MLPVVKSQNLINNVPAAATVPVTPNKHAAIQGISQVLQSPPSSSETFKITYAKSDPALSFDDLCRLLIGVAKTEAFKDFDPEGPLLRQILIAGYDRKVDTRTLKHWLKRAATDSVKKLRYVLLDALRRGQPKSPTNKEQIKFAQHDRFIITFLEKNYIFYVPISCFVLSDFICMSAVGINLAETQSVRTTQLVRFALTKFHADLLTIILNDGYPLASLFSLTFENEFSKFMMNKMKVILNTHRNANILNYLQALEKLGVRHQPTYTFSRNLLIKLLELETFKVGDALCQYLLSRGYHIPQGQENGRSALLSACRKLGTQHGVYLVKNLLELGADPNQRSLEGVLPFVIALQSKNAVAIQAFVTRGVNLNTPYQDSTLLHMVLADYPNIDLRPIMQQLNLFMLDSSGKSPVDIARATGNLAFLSLLPPPECPLEAVLIHNLHESVRALIRQLGLQHSLVLLKRLQQKYPQLNPDFLFNHLYEVTPRVELEGRPVEPGLHKHFLLIQQTIPSLFLKQVEEMIQAEKSANRDKRHKAYAAVARYGLIREVVPGLSILLYG